MKWIAMMIALLVQLVATRAALADLTTVDFSVLDINSIDITTVSNAEGYTLDGIISMYDDLGSGVDTASIDAGGIFGSTGGKLIFDFSGPAKTLDFDGSLLGVSSAVNGGVSVVLNNNGSIVTTLVVPVNSFTPYDPADLTLGGDALGSLAYSGAAFDQAVILFPPDAPFFSVAGLSYQSVVESASTSDLVATVIGPQQVDLTWTDNSGNGADDSDAEMGFRIERATGDGDFAALGTIEADVTAYSDTTAQPGTTYSYRVVAFNAVGDSLASNTATVSTGNTPLLPFCLCGLGLAETMLMSIGGLVFLRFGRRRDGF